MTSPHAAVAKSEYGGEVKAGPAVVSLRYVAEQTQYFALLIDRDRVVPLGREIEPSNLGSFERSDRRDRCRVDCLLIRKGRHSRKSLFALIKDQNERPAIVLGSQFSSHEPPHGKTWTRPLATRKAQFHKRWASC